MNSLKCPQCGLINFATAPECKRCHFEFHHSEEEAAPPPQAEQFIRTQTTAEPAQPTSFDFLPEYEPVATPIGGWLIVFILFLAVLLTSSVLYIRAAVKLFSTDAFYALTTPGSRIYIEMYAPGVTFEFIWLSLVGVCAVLILIRLFRKSSTLPRFAVTFLAVYIVAAFIDFLLGLSLQSQLTEKLAPLVSKAKMQEMFPTYIYTLTLLSMLVSAAWLIYFRTSSRVESTFIY